MILANFFLSLHQAKEILQTERLTAVADAGYSNGEHVQQCDENNIETYIPVNRAVNNQGNYFDKTEFIYHKETNSYQCPAGQLLTYKTYSSEQKLHLYTTNQCPTCPLKSHCTLQGNGGVSRHFFEEALNQLEARTHQHPEIMMKRRAIVEHPFGTIKRMMGNGRFLCRGLHKVRGEMALSILGYNLLRIINILGTKRLIQQLA